MRLHAIRLTNFRQHADTSIEFDGGITGIIGPNGTGKTTILEGIAWALYGNDAARGRRDTIRFVRAEPKAPVRVELEFELAGHHYRVVRGLTSAELYLDRGDEPIANSITSVGDLLQRRLGMSRSEFFNTYFTGQKEVNVMTSLGPTERAQFLSRVLGYERLRAAQDLLRERRRELLAELNGLRQAMPDPDVIARALAEAESRQADATARAVAERAVREHALAELTTVIPRWEAAQRARTMQQQAAADLRVAELDLVGRTRDYDRATGIVAEAEAASAELATIAQQLTSLPSLVTERETLDALAREEGRRQTLTDAVKAAEEDLARSAERRTQLADAPQLEEEVMLALEAKRQELLAANDQLETARTEWVRDRQEAETKRDALRRQYSEIKTQRDKIVEAGEDGICPTCQRPLGTHFRSVLDVLDAQLESIVLDGNYFKGRVEQLEAMPAAVAEFEERSKALSHDAGALERKVATVQAGARELEELTRAVARQERRLAGLRADVATLPPGYDVARHDTVRRELERLAPLEQRASRLAALADRAQAARTEVTSARVVRDAVASRVDALRAATGGDASADAAYEEVQLMHERANLAVHHAAVAKAKADAEEAAAAESLERARAARDELARAEERLGVLTRDRRMHDELDHAYTDVRTDLNFEMRPELSNIASGFLSELTDGRYSDLKLDDQYNLVVEEDGTPKPVLSGGEEDLANVVLRLAISQMIAERAGHPFSLLIFDEVFGSLDEAHARNVVALLRRLHDRFEQIILITHVESLRDDFDHIVTVQYDAGTGAAVVNAANEPLDVVEALAAVEP